MIAYKLVLGIIGIQYKLHLNDLYKEIQILIYDKTSYFHQ